MARPSAVRPTPNRRRGRWFAVLVMVVAALTTSMAPTVAPSASAESSSVEFLGTLDVPPPMEVASATSIIGMNHSTQRLYVRLDVQDAEGIRSSGHIAEYDMSTEVPTFVKMSEAAVTAAVVLTPNTVFVDESQERALILGKATGDLQQIEHIDLKTLALVDTWDMTTRVPGFIPSGMTYDERLDRIYLIGELDGTVLSQSVFSFGGTSDQAAAVVALDATSGALVWATKPRGCEVPLNAGQAGATIRMSGQRHLYFFCSAATTASQPTGQSGLLRMDIRGSDDAAGLVEFPTEFFPVSGNYSSGVFDTGVAGFDAATERFFAHSLASLTHGAWVFDGQRSSWIGFVAAPNSNNDKFGFDPATGKHYMGGGDNDTGFINVTDGRATPVPQGTLFDDIAVHHRPLDRVIRPVIVNGDVAVDPATQRLFVPYMIPSGDREQDRPAQGFMVLRDSTPTITPRSPLSLDELTHDLSDEDANLEFSANTAGFGANHAVVGGWENVYSRPTVPVFSLNVSEQQGASNPANIRYGTRGASTSFVDRVGIASSGSSASAIASKPDDNTPADAENKTRDVAGLVGDDGEEPEQFPYATCLDGVGEPVSTEEGAAEEPAHAVVRCDLENLETTAHARFSGGTGGGGVTVSRSSFNGRTFRDAERGVVTETEATAEGITFGEVDLGGVSIDRVTSTAVTVANGLAGTSYVRWERTVEGARTVDADGTASEPRSCSTIVESGKDVVEQGECDLLETQLNELFPNRFEIRFPMPEIVATPGGAFASVQETETDYLSGKATNNDQLRAVPGLEMTVFADGAQRGRLLTQLAAVKADATFIRSPIQHFEPFGSSPGAGDSGDTSTTAPSAPAPDQSAAAPPPADTTALPPPPTEGPEVAVDEDPDVFVSASHQERLVGAFGWLPALRSLGDAVLTGALYLVFLLPLLEVVRRRRLLGVLVGDEHADAPGIRPSPSHS